MPRTVLPLLTLLLLLLPGPALAQADDVDATTADEWIETTGSISLAADGSGTVDVDVALHEYLPPTRAFGCSPCTAGDIRNIHDNSDAGTRAVLINALEDGIEDQVRTIFTDLAQDVQVDAELDMTSLDADGEYEPPVAVDVTGTLRLALPEQVEGLLDAGALVQLPLPLEASAGHLIDLDLDTETLSFRTTPKDASTNGLRLAVDGRDATTATAGAIQVWVHRTGLTVATTSDARIKANLDLSQLDLHVWNTLTSLPSVTSGTPPSDLATLDLSFDLEMTLTSLGPDLLAQFAGQDLGVQAYFTAGALRNALASGILPPSALDDAVTRIEQQVQEGVGEMFPDAEPVVELINDDVSVNSVPVGEGPPITLTLSVSGALPLPPEDLGADGPGDGGAAGGTDGMSAVTLTEVPLPQIPLPALLGLPTTWRLSLPPGIELTDLGTSSAIPTPDGDGMTYIIMANQEGNTITPTMVVTHEFVLDQLFWPILITVLVLVALIAFVVYRVMRKRRGGGDGERPQADVRPHADERSEQSTEREIFGEGQ